MKAIDRATIEAFARCEAAFINGSAADLIGWEIPLVRKILNELSGTVKGSVTKEISVEVSRVQIGAANYNVVADEAGNAWQTLSRAPGVDPAANPIISIRVAGTP